MDTQEKKYVQGFNHGYVLAQYEPELANKLVNSVKEPDDYFNGFTSGQKQYELDKTRQSSKDISREISPDKNKEGRDI